MNKTFSAIAVAASLMLSLAGSRVQGSQPITALAFDDGQGVVAVAAPQGWEFDRKSPRAPDVKALIYPAGAPRTEKTSFIYVRTIPKQGHASLESLVSKEVEDRKAVSPDAKVVTGIPVKTVREQPALVRHFSSGKTGSFESAAYLESRGAYVVFVLSAKSEEARSEAQAAFFESVRLFHEGLRGTVFKR